MHPPPSGGADIPSHAPQRVAAGKGHKKRGGSRGRNSIGRQIESKVHERHEAWSERDPLARRHMPDPDRHIAPDELPAKDWTRPDRTERLGDQIADLYVDLKVVRVREERA